MMNPVLLLTLLGFVHARRVNLVSHRIKNVQETASGHQENAMEQYRLNATDAANLSDTSMWKPEPLVVNRASVPVAVYLECGFLFNMQVIQPGEAAILWSPARGPRLLTYSMIAVVGDESALPTEMDSLMNFAGVVAVPTAFVAGTVASVITVGALTGPSLALAPLVSGVPAVAGFTIATTDIAAGAAAASVAEVVAEKLVKEHGKSLMAKKRHIWPGTKYFEVVGGPAGNQGWKDLAIQEIGFHQYSQYQVKKERLCRALESEGLVAQASFAIVDVGDKRVEGNWRQIGRYNHRPRYAHVKNTNLILEWSNSRWAWRLLEQNRFGFGRPTLYISKMDSFTAPDSGWQAVDAGLPVPQVEKVMASESEHDDMDER